MSDEVQARLHELLTTLPGGPLLPPAGLGRRGRRRQRGRAALVSAGAVLSVVAVVLAVALAVPGTAHRTAPATASVPPTAPTASAPASETPALAAPGPCGGDDPEPVRRGPLTALRHTEQQVLAQVRSDRSARDRVVALTNGVYTWHDGGGAVTGAAWLVELLHVPDPVPGAVQVPVQREQVVLDDTELYAGGEVLDCALPPAERGATAELPPYARFRQPALQAQHPSGHTVEVPWRLQGIDAHGELAVASPHCAVGELAITAVETAQTVVVDVRRSLHGTSGKCLAVAPLLLHLRQPLGDRLLLHAAVPLPATSHASGTCTAEELTAHTEPREGSGGQLFYRFDLSTAGPPCRLDEYDRPVVGVRLDGSRLVLPTTSYPAGDAVSDSPSLVAPGHPSGLQLDTSSSTCPGVPIDLRALLLPAAGGELEVAPGPGGFQVCPDRLGFRAPRPG